MTETTIHMQEQLKKMAKVSARKQLYYSIGALIAHSMHQLKATVTACEVLRESEKGEGENAELVNEVPEGVKREMLKQEFVQLAAVYRMAISVRNYRNAFGENPEFVEFFKAQMPEGLEFEKWEEEMIRVYEKASKALGKNKKGETLVGHATFGKGFMTACDKIKIRGE